MLERTKLSEVAVHAVVRDAVLIETEFVRDALPVELIGMNSQAMIRYVEFCADRLIQALGYAKTFGTQNPFDWMELISLDGKTNFFEKRVGEYSRAAIGNNAVFVTDADF